MLVGVKDIDGECFRTGGSLTMPLSVLIVMSEGLPDVGGCGLHTGAEPNARGEESLEPGSGVCSSGVILLSGRRARGDTERLFAPLFRDNCLQHVFIMHSALAF